LSATRDEQNEQEILLAASGVEAKGKERFSPQSGEEQHIDETVSASDKSISSVDEGGGSSAVDALPKEEAQVAETISPASPEKKSEEISSSDLEQEKTEATLSAESEKASGETISSGWEEKKTEDTSSAASGEELEGEKTVTSSSKAEEKIEDIATTSSITPAEPKGEPAVSPPPPIATPMAATDVTGAIYADGVLRDFDAEAAAEKAFKNRWRQSDNALLIISWRAHGRQKERTIKFPKFMNRFFPELNAPLYVPPPPQPEPELPVEEPPKPKEPEDPEEAWEKKKKRWRGWAYVFTGTALIMYLYDWYRSRSNARLEAEEIGAPTTKEKRIMSNLALLLKENVVEFHDWLRENEGEEITVDIFGERLAAASKLFKESNKDMPQLKDFLDKHKPGKQDNGENYPYEYSQNIEAYDAACLYRDIPNLDGESKVPLPVLITGISQIIKCNEMPAKIDCGFLAFSLAEGADDKKLSFDGLVKLIDAMMTTGHFLTDTLVNHVKFLPHRYEVATARDIAEEHFRCHELDPESDARISLEQFKESNIELPRRRWYKIFEPGYALWYCTRSQIEEAEEKRKKWEKEQEEAKEKEKQEAEEAKDNN